MHPESHGGSHEPAIDTNAGEKPGNVLHVHVAVCAIDILIHIVAQPKE